MRKLVLLSTASAAALAMAATAFAQSSQYDVSASTSPVKAGSKKAPVAASLRLHVKVQGTARPSTSREFKVTFGGLRGNTKPFKACTVASINAAQGDSGCSRAARIGRGFVKNLVGQAGDPNDVSISCNLAVTLYNAGNGRIAVFLKGSSTTVVAGGNCPIPVNQALDGKFVNTRAGVSLSFTIPDNLMHPITGLNQGISEIETSIDKKVVSVRKGKKKAKVAYLEAVGGCKGGQRAVTLELATETGASSTSKGFAKC